MEKLNGENSIESVKWDFLKPFSIINRKKTLEINLSKAMRVKWCRKVLCSVILKFWQTQETALSDSKVQFGVKVSLQHKLQWLLGCKDTKGDTNINPQIHREIKNPCHQRLLTLFRVNI